MTLLLLLLFAAAFLGLGFVWGVLVGCADRRGDATAAEREYAVSLPPATVRCCCGLASCRGDICVARDRQNRDAAQVEKWLTAIDTEATP